MAGRFDISKEKLLLHVIPKYFEKVPSDNSIFETISEIVFILTALGIMRQVGNNPRDIHCSTQTVNTSSLSLIDEILIVTYQNVL